MSDHDELCPYPTGDVRRVTGESFCACDRLAAAAEREREQIMDSMKPRLKRGPKGPAPKRRPPHLQ